MSDESKVAAAARDEPLAKGATLAGGYVVEEVVGQGGMAVVYRAIQKSLNRPVALKVLHARFSRDPQFIERFEGESGALASLSHPNIVNIIDRGHDNGHYFFVMELVEGLTLDQLIIKGGLTRADWKRFVTACREALDYVHKRGVVHRDIKPSNILVNSEGAIKIGDFGIAHIVHGNEEARAQSKGSQPRAVGTANYMAPEQTSKPSGVDQRADVFSLAVTFYKMMTRTLPVGNFPMPSEANPDVPSSVDPVLVKAMAHDREERYATVAAFCDDLMKALKDQGTSITSILGTRRAGMVGAGSLYTGDDFRKSPSSSSSARDSWVRLPERTPKPARSKHTPQPASGTFSTSDMLRSLTPLPLEREGSGAGTPPPAKGLDPKAPSPPVKKESTSDRRKEDPPAVPPHAGGRLAVALAISVGLVGLLLLGGVLLVIFNEREQDPDGITAAENGAVPRVSDQRERMLEELAREREREILQQREQTQGQREQMQGMFEAPDPSAFDDSDGPQPLPDLPDDDLSPANDFAPVAPPDNSAPPPPDGL